MVSYIKLETNEYTIVITNKKDKVEYQISEFGAGYKNSVELIYTDNTCNIFLNGIEVTPEHIEYQDVMDIKEKVISGAQYLKLGGKEYISIVETLDTKIKNATAKITARLV